MQLKFFNIYKDIQLIIVFNIVLLKLNMNLRINGGNKVNGELSISGSKNDFLPIITACCLTDTEVLLNNIPLIEDFYDKVEMVKGMGASVVFEKTRTIKVNTKDIIPEISQNNRIRTSILFSGVLLGRFGYCRIPYPKGDKIGARNTNFHFDALTQMGAAFTFFENYFEAKTDKLIGVEYTLPFASVGATQNILMAASIAHGTTVINNAAMEPEIISLCNFLIKIGVKIKGVGQSRITITGSNGKIYSNLDTISYSIICDRLQAATYLIAAAMTDGKVTIFGNDLIFTLGSLLNYLVNLGMELTCGENFITCESKPLSQLKDMEISTNIFPGLATDLQPLLVPLLAKRSNFAILSDMIFDNRFQYIYELNKMGGDFILQDKNTLFVYHIDQFSAHKGLIAQDIRCGASILLAAINAKDQSKILNSYQIYRGYDNLIENFSQIGVDINIDYEENYLLF